MSQQQDYHLKDEESVAKMVKYSSVVVNLLGKDFETRYYHNTPSTISSFMSTMYPFILPLFYKFVSNAIVIWMNLGIFVLLACLLVCLSICLSTTGLFVLLLFICSFISLWVCLPVCLSFCLTVCLLHLSVFGLFNCLIISLWVCLLDCLLIFLLICLFVHLSVFFYIFISVYELDCLFAYLSAYLSVLFVCVCVSSFICLFAYLFAVCVTLFVHLCVSSFICLFGCLFAHLFMFVIVLLDLLNTHSPDRNLYTSQRQRNNPCHWNTWTNGNTACTPHPDKKIQYDNVSTQE